MDEHRAFAAGLRERGQHVAGEALESSGGAVVRPGDPPIVTDGPFAATKEAVGGFYLVECSDRDEAIRLATQVPQSPRLAVEVLPVAEV